VTAVGVRLAEAPDAPSRGEVRIRIPSGQCCKRQWRAALGDTHPSGDIQSLHAPGSRPGRVTHAAIGQMRVGTGIAECTTTGLMVQDGGDSWNCTTPRYEAVLGGERSPNGDLASWKDPL
jgi:hypothetical protein